MNLKVSASSSVVALTGACLATVLLVWLMAILVVPKIHEGEQKRSTIVLETVDLIDPVIEKKKKPKEKPPEQPPVSQPTPPKVAQPQQAPPAKMAMDNLFDFADPQLTGLQSGDLAVNPINVAPTSLNQTPTFSRAAQTIVSVNPVYPVMAAKRNISGSVEVDFIINAQGKAQDIQVIKSEPEGVFERAVIKAVRKTKFQPLIENGEVVLVRSTKTYTFNGAGQ